MNFKFWLLLSEVDTTIDPGKPMTMAQVYKTLDLELGATEEEATKKYRQLARSYHPDRNIGDKEAELKFKIIQKAYDTFIGRASPAGTTATRDYRQASRSYTPPQPQADPIQEAKKNALQLIDKVIQNLDKASRDEANFTKYIQDIIPIMGRLAESRNSPLLKLANAGKLNPLYSIDLIKELIRLATKSAKEVNLQAFNTAINTVKSNVSNVQ